MQTIKLENKINDRSAKWGLFEDGDHWKGEVKGERKGE
jgi:hypothetical protein